MSSRSSAIIMAAGKGTRMKSALPKVLHPLLGRTLLSHSMHAVMGLNPENLVVVVRHDRDAVAAEAHQVEPSSLIADQDDIPGTGRAVQCGLEQARAQNHPLSGTVIVTSADVPLLETRTLQELVETHERAGAAVTIVSTIADDPSGYGRVVRNPSAQNQVLAIVEHRDATPEQLEIPEINAGIYAFDAEFLEHALRQIDQDNDQGEAYLTDTAAVAVREGKLAQAFVLEDSWQAEGCNDLWQLAALREELGRRICESHCKSGVSIVDPSTTSIDIDVSIGPDAVIRPFTSLAGSTSVGSHADIGPGTTLIDTEVGSGAKVPSSYLEDQEVPSSTVLSPFTVATGGSRPTRGEIK